MPHREKVIQFPIISASASVAREVEEFERHLRDAHYLQLESILRMEQARKRMSEIAQLLVAPQ